jgi:potassium-transporting ATPase ATP-binding subunit
VVKLIGPLRSISEPEKDIPMEVVQGSYTSNSENRKLREVRTFSNISRSILTHYRKIGISLIATAVCFFLFLKLQEFILPAAVLALIYVELAWVQRRIKGYSSRDLSPLKKATNEYALRFENLDFTRIQIEDLNVGDEVLCEAGRTVPADGRVIDGLALVDESAITGESAPVVRDSTEEKSFVTEGTRILTNRILIRWSKRPKLGFKAKIHSILDSHLGSRSKSEIIARRWAIGTSIGSFFIVLLTLLFTEPDSVQFWQHLSLGFAVSSLCLIPIWFLPRLHRFLGIAFVDQLIHRNLIPGDIDTLERSGSIKTIIIPRDEKLHIAKKIEVKELIPAPNVDLEHLARIAQLAALCDESEVSRAIATYVKMHFGFLAQSLENKQVQLISGEKNSGLSGLHIFSDEGEDGVRSILMGNLNSIKRHVEGLGGFVPKTIENAFQSIQQAGDTAIIVCDGYHAMGLIHFSRNLDNSSAQGLESYERLGIEVISFINSETHGGRGQPSEAAAKLALVKKLQTEGKEVAFIGEDISDLPSLAQADLSLVANVGNESLIKLSHVANVSGDHWRFKHLFSLGQDLVIRRKDLNAIWIAGAMATWIALLPMLGGMLFGSAKFPWLTNPLHLFSVQSGAWASGIVALINLAILGISLVGLHDRRGIVYAIARVIFGSPIKTLQILCVSLLLIKLFNLGITVA